MTKNDNLQKNNNFQKKNDLRKIIRNLLLRGNAVDGHPVYIHYIECLLSKF